MAGDVRELQFEFSAAAASVHLDADIDKTQAEQVSNTDIGSRTQRVCDSPTAYAEPA